MSQSVWAAAVAAGGVADGKHFSSARPRVTPLSAFSLIASATGLSVSIFFLDKVSPAWSFLEKFDWSL